MNRFCKILITFCFLLVINNLVQSQVVTDSVFYYLVNKEKQNIKNAFSMTLFIHNANEDSISIPEFNKYIANISAFNFKKTQERIFYWSLQTLSNKEPEDIIFVFPLEPIIKRPKKQTQKNVNIMISPHSTFTSDVYMVFSPFLIYPKGYYKLCLFCSATNKCIAETIIEVK